MAGIKTRQGIKGISIRNICFMISELGGKRGIDIGIVNWLGSDGCQICCG
jgi:hypothetical protein